MTESFFSAFTQREPRALQLLPSDYTDPGARLAAVKLIGTRRIDPAFLSILIKQNRLYAPSALREKHLQKLAIPGSIAVVTGQQTGLFLGPLLTLYKALSVVVMAKQLEQESGIPVVPIFWLQTEDHDFAEINHSWIINHEDQLQKIELTGEASRISIKYRNLGEQVIRSLSTIQAALGNLPFVDVVTDLLKQHYLPTRSISDAFAQCFSALLADEGLIFFDPRDPEAARHCMAVYRRAILEEETIYSLLLNQTEQLKRSGFDAQVHLRPHSPLIFYHQNNADGPRFRIEQQANGYSLVGAHELIKKDVLTKLVETNPERFSSSALLRPIVQDSLFPSAAYVAGPNEINYFAQLSPLYRLFSLPHPLIVPRSSFILLEPKARRLLEKLKLSLSDLELPATAIAAKLALHASGPAPDELFGAAELGIVNSFDALSSAFAQVDQTLLGSLSKSREKTLAQLNMLKDKYTQAKAGGDERTSERLQWLQSNLVPQGESQERRLSLLYFLAKYGFELKNLLLSNLTAFNPARKELHL